MRRILWCLVLSACGGSGGGDDPPADGEPAPYPSPYAMRTMTPEVAAPLHGVVSDFGSRGEGTAGEPTWGHNTPKIALWQGLRYFVFLSMEGTPEQPDGWSWRLARVNPATEMVELGFAVTRGVRQPGTLILDRNGYAHGFDFGDIANGFGVRHVVSKTPVHQDGWDEYRSLSPVGPGIFGYIGVAYDAALHRVYLAAPRWNGGLVDLHLTWADLPEDPADGVTWEPWLWVSTADPDFAPTYPYVVPIAADAVVVSWLSASRSAPHYRDIRVRIIELSGAPSPEDTLAPVPDASVSVDLADVHFSGGRLWVLIQRNWAHAGQPGGTHFVTSTDVSGGSLSGWTPEVAVRAGGDAASYAGGKLVAHAGGFRAVLLTTQGVTVYAADDLPGSAWAVEAVLQPTIDPAFPGDPEILSHPAVRKPWWGGEDDPSEDVLYSSDQPRTHPLGFAPVYNVWYLRLAP